MYQVGILGAAWGIGIWVLWTGYFLVYSPSWFRKFILARKWRVIIVDLVITYLGSNIILSTSGSMVAGIGSGVLMLLCFCSSALVIFILKMIDVYRTLLGRKRYV